MECLPSSGDSMRYNNNNNNNLLRYFILLSGSVFFLLLLSFWVRPSDQPAHKRKKKKCTRTAGSLCFIFVRLISQLFKSKKKTKATERTRRLRPKRFFLFFLFFYCWTADGPTTFSLKVSASASFFLS
jgi:hypothetical protein